jgi:hypothetical protein
MRFPTCTVTNGVFTQYGQMTQVDAIYNNCPAARTARSSSRVPVRARRHRRHVHGQGQQLLVPRQHRRDAGPEIAVVFG